MTGSTDAARLAEIDRQNKLQSEWPGASATRVITELLAIARRFEADNKELRELDAANGLALGTTAASLKIAQERAERAEASLADFRNWNAIYIQRQKEAEKERDAARANYASACKALEMSNTGWQKDGVKLAKAEADLARLREAIKDFLAVDCSGVSAGPCVHGKLQAALSPSPAPEPAKCPHWWKNAITGNCYWCGYPNNMAPEPPKAEPCPKVTAVWDCDCDVCEAIREALGA